jgi:phosphoribosylformylglycinamidine synthase subunit PurQ / glutaminase
MATPKVCVIRAPGTNCDIETAHAFELAGAEAERIHLFRVLENPGLLSEFQIFCIPGGFSYGDDIAAGIIFSQQLRGQLLDAIGKFLSADKLVLGICNGFQVLLKSGILPDGSKNWPKEQEETTLTWNENGKYTALWVKLKVASSNNVFLKGIDEIELPIAHAEGRIAVSSKDLPEIWKKQNQVSMRYISGNGDHDSESILEYPLNPNGSLANIAGLNDESGRVFGLMPHPERFIHATQHPNWTRLNLKGEGEGLKLFKNAVDYFG